MSVAELCRRAGVSRSTFYVHFDGVHDVFQVLVDDFSSQTLSLREQLHCAECLPGKKAYCTQLREAGRFAPLVADPAYRAALIARGGAGATGDAGLAADLVESGMNPQVAQAVQLFQEGGCYAAATEIPADVDWPKIQAALDRFIRAGLSAIKNG